MKSSLIRYGGSHTFTRINSTTFVFNFEPHPTDLYSDEERHEIKDTIGGKRILQSFGFHECDRELVINTWLKSNNALDLRDARRLRYQWTYKNWDGYTRIVRFHPGKQGLTIDFENAKFQDGSWAFRTTMTFMVCAEV